MTTASSKRVLFVCPTGDLNSGGEKSNFELIKYLKKRKYEVSVITAWDGEYSRALDSYGIYNISGNYKWWAPWDNIEDTASDSVMGLAETLKVIKDINPDVVVTNTLNIPWGALAASMTNIPHIWISREFPEGEFNYLDSKMGFINKFSNQIMANSKMLAQRIAREYKLDIEHFYSYVDEKAISLGKRKDEPRIVSLNGITERKNQIELVEAVALLSNRGFASFDVLLMGVADSKYKARLERLIDEYSLDERVKILPFNSKPWSLVGYNDILVQTSLSESIGRTITESMKLGVPVIASDIPGHQEAIELGGGTLYRSGDASDLADKINFALTNIDKLKKDALRTKSKAIVNMSEKACNEPFIDVLERVFGKRNPMSEMGHIEPYLSHHISVSREWLRDTEKLSDKVDECEAVASDLRGLANRLEYENSNIINSRAYKLGLFQSRILGRIFKKRKRKDLLD